MLGSAQRLLLPMEMCRTAPAPQRPRELLPEELCAWPAASGWGQGQQRTNETIISSGEPAVLCSSGALGNCVCCYSLTLNFISTQTPPEPCRFTCTAGMAKQRGTRARAEPCLSGAPGKGPRLLRQESHPISSASERARAFQAFFSFFFFDTCLYLYFPPFAGQSPHPSSSPRSSGDRLIACPARQSPTSCSWLPAHACRCITIITINEA